MVPLFYFGLVGSVDFFLVGVLREEFFAKLFKVVGSLNVGDALIPLEFGGRFEEVDLVFDFEVLPGGDELFGEESFGEHKEEFDFFFARTKVLDFVNLLFSPFLDNLRNFIIKDHLQ